MRDLTDNADGAGVFLDSGTSLVATGTVFDGNGPGNSNSGGAIYGDSAVSIELTDCIVSVNSAAEAGAIRLSSTDGVFVRTQFTANSTDNGDGGAVWVSDADLTLEDCTFTDNLGDNGHGGAVYASGTSDLVVIGGSFTGNDADGDGGAIAHVPAGTRTLSITSAVFQNNIADLNANNAGSGGGVFADGVTTVTVLDTRFDANIAENGGGLDVAGASTYTVGRTEFCANDSASDGGGLRLTDTSGSVSGRIHNSLFADNICGDDGGGIHVDDSDGEFRNNNLIANNCPGGGHVGDGLYTLDNATSVTFEGNVVAHHVGQGVNEFQGTVSADYNLWFDNGVDTVSTTVGANAQFGDPDFLAFTNNGVCDDDYAPMIGSLLIDNGNPGAAFADVDGSANDIGIFGGPDAALYDSDGDGDLDDTDCAPLDPTIFTGAVEIPGDGVDQDCDGFELCYDDNDNDGWGSATEQLEADLSCDANEADNNLDCDDTAPGSYPGAVGSAGHRRRRELRWLRAVLRRPRQRRIRRRHPGGQLGLGLLQRRRGRPDWRLCRWRSCTQPRRRRDPGLWRRRGL